MISLLHALIGFSFDLDNSMIHNLVVPMMVKNNQNVYAPNLKYEMMKLYIHTLYLGGAKNC